MLSTPFPWPVLHPDKSPHFNTPRWQERFLHSLSRMELLTAISDIKPTYTVYHFGGNLRRTFIKCQQKIIIKYHTLRHKKSRNYFPSTWPMQLLFPSRRGWVGVCSGGSTLSPCGHKHPRRFFKFHVWNTTGGYEGGLVAWGNVCREKHETALGPRQADRLGGKELKSAQTRDILRVHQLFPRYQNQNRNGLRIVGMINRLGSGY